MSDRMPMLEVYEVHKLFKVYGPPRKAKELQSLMDRGKSDALTDEEMAKLLNTKGFGGLSSIPFAVKVSRRRK